MNFETSFRDEFYQLLRARRSIRKYQTRELEPALIEKILLAGMEAPSGKNRQNWRFVVVTGEKLNEYLRLSQKSWLGLKDNLKKRLKPSLYEFTERFFFNLGGAPCLVFCYSHNSHEERYLTSVGSVYMAVENICLAALVEGLGTCTMGAPLEIRAEVDDFLNMKQYPEFRAGELELLCAITIGYADHDPPKSPRQIEGRIRWLARSDQ